MMLARRALLLGVVGLIAVRQSSQRFWSIFWGEAPFSALLGGAVFFLVLIVVLSSLPMVFIKSPRRSLGPFCSPRIIRDYKGLRNFGMIEKP
jgi:hypothetical protein